MTTLREADTKAKQAPLRELLASVPTDARLVIDDADGKGTRSIPVGRLCQEAATALAEHYCDTHCTWANHTQGCALAEPVQEPVAWVRHSEEQDMKQLNHRFEHWYRLTHWMSPELTKRLDDSYENETVQAMYVAYRAGFNRANKERKEMYNEDKALLRRALEAMQSVNHANYSWACVEAIAALRGRLGENHEKE